MGTHTTHQSIDITIHDRKVASTGGTDQVTIVASTIPTTCHDTQRGWSTGDRLYPFDSTGVGQWQTAGYVQCGQCGSLQGPVAYRLLVDAGDEEVAAAAHEVDVAAGAWQAEQTAETFRRLTEMMTTAARRLAALGIDPTTDIDWGEIIDGETVYETVTGDLPAGSEVEPGFCLDSGTLIVWDFHPADVIGSDTILVTLDQVAS